MARRIVEREHELAELAVAARAAAGGTGCVALVSGEPGIGKSSLVGALRSVLPAEGRVLVGWCDSLAVPRTLGPLRDLVGTVGAPLAAALGTGDRGAVMEALRAELARPPGPTVLVVEDVHWVDEATLDALRYLTRRIAALPAVLVLTYRDEDVDPVHPLRDLLGLAARTQGVRHLPLRRLSEAAVRDLASGTGVEPTAVYAATAGNPFLVAELLSSADPDSVPPTIADAVAERLRALPAASRAAVEQLAVVPSASEGWLVDALLPGGPDAAQADLAPAEQRGLLATSAAAGGTGVAFRHELVRRAVVDGLPAGRRAALERRVLDALVARDRADLSRIVHHAGQAGAVDELVAYGPRAAAEASAAGSHRAAAEHYRRVLEHRDRFGPAERADLLQASAVESYTLGDTAAAVAAQTEAVALRREAGDPRALGAALRWASRIAWTGGDPDAAEAASTEAVAVLEGVDEGLLALARSSRSQLLALAGRWEEAVAVGEPAIAAARRLGDLGTLSHALDNVGFATWELHGQAHGRPLLEESLAVALAAREPEHALRAYVNIAWYLVEDVELDAAAACIEPALRYADEVEHGTFRCYLHLERALLRSLRGAWDDAADDAAVALEGPPVSRSPALVVLGRIRSRRGLAGAAEALSEAAGLAAGMREAQRVGPVAVAQAEAALLAGDGPAARAAVEAVAEEVGARGCGGLRAEVAYWLLRTGAAATVDLSGVTHPYALQTAGDWRGAADAWAAAGCPYEHAVALTEGGGTEDLLAALATFDALDARPMARDVRRRLREAGVERVPRGPLPTTREHPAGLTARQADVLALLAAGRTNAAIAEELVLSVRTVDHHVAAVLDKLGVGSRQEAVDRATRLGLLADVRG